MLVCIMNDIMEALDNTGGRWGDIRIFTLGIMVQDSWRTFGSPTGGDSETSTDKSVVDLPELLKQEAADFSRR